MPVRAVLLALALSVVGSCALAATAMASSGDAVAYQENAGHTGAIPDSSPTPPLMRKWSLSLGTIVGHPLIVDDLVIAAVQKSDTYGDTEIQARDRLTGALVWSQTGGGTYWDLGLAADAGRLYAVNFDGQLRAFNLDTGAVLWERNLTQQSSFSNDPVAADGVVYVIGAGSGNTLWAINGATGQNVWVDSNVGGTTPAVDATRLYLSDSCGQTWAIDRQSGAVDWYDAGSCFGGGYGTDLVAGNRVYVRDLSGTGYVYDASTGNSVDAFSATSPPAFSAGLGVYPTGSGLRAQDQTTDALKWTYSPTGGIEPTVVATGSTAYVLDGGGNLDAVDLATGANVWSGATGFGAISPPSTGTGPISGLAVGEGTVAVPNNGGLAVFTLPGPDTEITQGPALYGAGTTAHFAFGSDTAGATFECSTDHGPWSACTSPVDLTGLAAGSHTFSVRAVSGAVPDPDPSTRIWTVGSAADASIISGPPSLTGSTSATFTFNAGTSTVSYQCALDSGAWSPCTSPALYSGLADGSHTFAVRSVDQGGNPDPTSATTTWTVDTTPPQSSIASAPDSTTTSTIAGFTFTASESATFECQLDTSGWQPCTSPWAYDSLGAGSHSFQVRATDLAGNVDPTPAVAMWTVQAPVTNPGITTTTATTTVTTTTTTPAPNTPAPVPSTTTSAPAVTTASVMPALRSLTERIAGELSPRAIKRIAAGHGLVVRGVHLAFSGVLIVSLDAKSRMTATGLVITGTPLSSTLRLGVTGPGRTLLRKRLSRITVAAALKLAGGKMLHSSRLVHLAR